MYIFQTADKVVLLAVLVGTFGFSMLYLHMYTKLLDRFDWRLNAGLSFALTATSFLAAATVIWLGHCTGLWFLGYLIVGSVFPKFIFKAVRWIAAKE